MATNKEILSAIEELTNGNGIEGIKRNLESIKSDISELKEDVSQLKVDVNLLKSDVSELKKDSNEIRDHGFANENSLRNRLANLETSVENIKKYEIAEIKRKFETNSSNKNSIFLKVVGGAILLAVGYIFNLLVG